MGLRAKNQASAICAGGALLLGGVPLIPVAKR
jgi:hypothetical protein